MANGIQIQCIVPYVTRQQCNTIYSKTLQLHKRNNQLSSDMTYLLIIMLAPSHIPSEVIKKKSTALTVTNHCHQLCLLVNVFFTQNT